MGSKVTNNGRIALQLGFNCWYAASIAQNEEKVLVGMLYFTPDRDFVVFRNIAMY